MSPSRELAPRSSGHRLHRARRPQEGPVQTLLSVSPRGWQGTAGALTGCGRATEDDARQLWESDRIREGRAEGRPQDQPGREHIGRPPSKAGAPTAPGTWPSWGAKAAGSLARREATVRKLRSNLSPAPCPLVRCAVSYRSRNGVERPEGLWRRGESRCRVAAGSYIGGHQRRLLGTLSLTSPFRTYPSFLASRSMPASVANSAACRRSSWFLRM